MAKITIFGVLSNIQMLLLAALQGNYVGTDHDGNKYYRAKPRGGQKQDRRWVIYKGEMEASLIPAEWHGWMHHQTDVIPGKTNDYRKKWIKAPKPNLTGTEFAYMPPAAKGKKRAAATADYVSWTPPT